MQHPASLGLPIAPEDIFRPTPRSGQIRRWDGPRAVIASDGLLQGLHEGLEEALGDAAADSLAVRAGVTWAEREMARLTRSLQQAPAGAPLDIRDQPPSALWTQWRWPLTVGGWGSWTFDLSMIDRGIALVDLTDSAVARSVGQVGRPVCHLYAGLFAGAFTWYHRAAREAIEVSCTAAGADICRFLVGEPHHIDEATLLLQEGASAQEILRELAQR